MSSATVQPPVQPRPAQRPQLRAAELERLIDDRIEATRRGLKLVDLAATLVVLAIATFAFLLTAALLEHWIFTGGLPTVLRTLMFVSFIGFSGWYLWRRVAPLVLQRINPDYAAHAIEADNPSLKNSLLSVLQLRQHKKKMAPAVILAVEEQAARGLTSHEVDTAVDRTPLLRAGYVLAAMVLVVMLYAVLSPKSLATSAARMLMPWADIQPPSRVQIDNVKPGDADLVQGELLELSARVSQLASDEQVQLEVTPRSGESYMVSMRSDDDDPSLHSVRLPHQASDVPLGLQQSFTYRVLAGDAQSRSYSVDVAPAPTIRVTKVRYDFPTYTGYVDRTMEGLPDIRAIDGTRVMIVSEANSDIAEAYLDFSADGRKDISMQVDGRVATVSWELALPKDGSSPPANYALRFKTPTGATNRQPPLHSIEILPDLAPEVEVLDPRTRVIEVAADEQVTILLEARDPDFALSQVEVRMQKADGTDLPAKTFLDAPHRGRFNARWEFTPQEIKLAPGDVVAYWATATDNRSPRANTAESGRREIHVLGPNNPNPQQGEGGQPNGEPGGGEPNGGQNGDPSGQQDGQPGGEGENGSQDSGNNNGQPNGGANHGERGAEPQEGEQPGESNSTEGNQPGEGASEGSDQNDGGDSQQGEPQDGMSEGSEGGDANNQGESGGQESGDSESAEPNGGAQGSGGQNAGDSSNQNPNGGQRNGNGGGDPSQATKPVADDGSDDANAFDRIRRHMNEQEKAHSQRKPSDADPSETTGERDGSQEEGPPQGDTQPNGGEGQNAKPEGSNNASEDGGQNGENQTDAAQSDQGNDPGDSQQRDPSEGSEGEAADGSQPDDQQSSGGSSGESGDSTSTDSQSSSSEAEAQSEEGVGEGDSETGSPEAQRDAAQRDKTSDPEEGNPEGDGNEQSPGTSKHESDSRGEEGGDREGGGTEGGGQQAPREGTGSEGQNQAADKGAGESADEGPGTNSEEGGDGPEAEGETGSAGKQAGEGSEQQTGGDQPGGSEPGGTGSDGADGQPSDLRNSPDASPGSVPMGGKGGPGSGEGAAAGDQLLGGDKANLDYAREQTDLVLENLQDQLNDKQVDKELLDELGWTEEQLRAFVERWNKRKSAAATGDDAAQVELDQALRSLDLKRDTVAGRTNRTADDNRDFAQDQKRTTPAKWRDRVKWYTDSLGKSRDNN